MFEYQGSNHPYGMKDLDLAFYGIVEPNKTFKKGDTIEIEDTPTNQEIINRMKFNGLFQQIKTNKKIYKKNKKTEGGVE